MNYNLLWFVWIIWAAALMVYGLGWVSTLAMIRQYRTLLIALSIAIAASVALRKLLFNKEMTMFKRKENSLYSPQQPAQQPATSLARSTEEDILARPESDFQEGVSAAVVVNVTDTTTIPESCIITGEVRAVGDIHINGTIYGNVRSDKTVFVQKNGQVEGEIHSQRAEISGELKGLCHSREVALNAQGYMDGTIECESLSINQRARFYGQSKPWDEASTKTDASNVVQSFIESAALSERGAYPPEQ